MAPQVFEVAVTDATLAPEEIQCAVNAALYAHLLSGGAAPELQATTTGAPAGKRPRVA